MSLTPQCWHQGHVSLSLAPAAIAECMMKPQASAIGHDRFTQDANCLQCQTSMVEE